MVDRVAMEFGLFAVHVQTPCSSDWNSFNFQSGCTIGVAAQKVLYSIRKMMHTLTAK